MAMSCQLNESEVTIVEGAESLEAEIRNIVNLYGSHCKIIKHAGDFLYILTIQFAKHGLAMKFQITEKYPDERPIVIVTWKDQSRVDDSLKAQLQIQTTIKQMLQTVEKYLENQPVYIEEKPKKSAKQISKAKLTGYRTDKPKPKMKTAIDVIMRIKWDENLQSRDFSVGYVDRFLGIVEKYFEDFSWKDPAIVDDHVELAIPKHRIEYFKYKNFIVWEKKSRTDYVFGSSGTKKMTIYEVMDKYSELVNEPEENESESDSDVDIGINIVPRNEPSEIEDYWGNKLRPNHFIAIRISDTEILSMVDHIQDTIITKQPQYESCCIPPSALHVTVCTLRLESESQIQTVKQALNEIKDDLSALKTTIAIEGTDTFFNRVLYAKVHYEDEFIKFVDAIKLTIRTSGTELLDGHDFVPHMTIMKTSRPVAKVFGRDLPQFIYSGLEKVIFGKQIVDNVHLCAMKEEWSEGFYACSMKMQL